MKILLFWPYFYPDEYGIGCSIRGEAFAKYLNKKDVVVSVLVPEKKDVNKIRIEYEGCIVDRVKTYNTIGESHPFFLSLLYLPVSVMRLIIKVKKIRPNLIIASTPGPFMPLEGSLVAKCLGIPFVFDMEDSWHLTRYSHKGILRNKVKMFLERLCATHADMIFTVTPTLKRIISKGYKISSDKIKIVYNGVDLEQFPILEKQEDIIDLIHLGSPRIYYDTLKLIDAYSIIIRNRPNTSLRFIGCTNEDYVKKIKKYAEEKGVFKKIEFTSPIPHEKVPYELAKARIGVISLVDRVEYTSAIGVKVFEYMAAGLPTAYLGPSESEQEDLIMENNIGVYASNPAEFAEKVASLLNDKSTRDVMSANATEAIKHYAWEKIVKEVYEKHIEKVRGVTTQLSHG